MKELLPYSSVMKLRHFNIWFLERELGYIVPYLIIYLEELKALKVMIIFQNK